MAFGEAVLVKGEPRMFSHCAIGSRVAVAPSCLLDGERDESREHESDRDRERTCCLIVSKNARVPGEVGEGAARSGLWRTGG